MNVSYVSMAFPTSEETFACSDVRALRALGVRLSVYAIRGARITGLNEPTDLFRFRARRRATEQLLAERGLGDLPLSRNTPAAMLRGILFAATHTGILRELLSWVWRCNQRSLRHLVKSVALIPRTLDIFRSIHRERPDVVHLFWGHYPAMVGYLVRRHLPDIVLSMFLGAYDLERQYPGSAALARSADVVWTHCKHNLSRVAELGVPRSRLRMVYRGIDVGLFSDGGGEKIPQRIVTAGRLVPEKAMHDVFAMFAKVLRRWPKASLVVLGDGPERKHLASQAQTLGVSAAVTFRGHVPSLDVRDSMASAEVFVLLSRSVSERLPNVAKEAMASRCACIISESPGIEELVEHGVSGFVVPQGDIDAAAEYVDQLFRDRARRSAVASVGRARVLAQFDLNRSIQAYRDHWIALLQRRRYNRTGFPAPATEGAAGTRQRATRAAL